MTTDDSFEPADRQLCSIAKLDADQYLADSKLLFANAIYTLIAVKSTSLAYNVLQPQWWSCSTTNSTSITMPGWFFFTNTACNFFIMRASTQ